MHITQMGTRTISVKDEAYKRLRAARRHSSESFSEVVMRATWPEDTITARAFLDLHTRRRFFRESDLARIEAAKRRDKPPEDKWSR